MKAIVTKDLGHAELVHNRPIPNLDDDYILVKTVAVALNPVDWKKIDSQPASGSITGHDYSGIVEEIGKAVIKSFRKGDRVAGLVMGGDHIKPDSGTFAEFIVAKGDNQLHVPDDVSFEEASAMGVAANTAGLSLFKELQIQQSSNAKSGEGEYLLIYGGSTACGTLGIQLATL
jgi:NADPH:quinone reductase-like Zn-dependent oxidoreductase